MTRVSGFAYNQGKYLLENYRQAILCASLFAAFPYTVWLSAAVIALITLRQGAKQGNLLWMGAMLTHFLVAQTRLPLFPACISTLLSFVPVFLAACLLRMTASWRFVAGLFLVQVFLVTLLLQWCAPDFIKAQFVYFQSVIQAMHAEDALSQYLVDLNAQKILVFANYLLGIQAAGVVISALLSLSLARALQSLVCNPGGFTKELLGYRGHKVELLLLIGILIMANQDGLLAINLLPIMLLHFLLAGLSLSFNVFYKTKPLRTLMLLIVPLIFLPMVMFMIYVIFGSLDSLFNFRLYLHRADESI